MSYELAARCLGVSEGTIRGRLAKARKLLRCRLARPFESSHPRDDVPKALVLATARAATRVMADRLGTTGVSTAVIYLMQGVLSMTFVTRTRLALAVVAGIGLAIACASALASKSSYVEPLVSADCFEPLIGFRSSARAADARNASSANRMTLDEAIERCMRESAGQRARFELSAAEAERLTRPGTNRPRRLVEAAYQDFVRTQIDAVYKKFVAVEVLQVKLQHSVENLAKWNRLLEANQNLFEKGTRPADDIDRIRTARDAARSKREQASGALREAKMALGSLLNLPVKEREILEVASRLSRLRSAVLPSLDGLLPLALDLRPDLAALRLGERRASGDLAIALANRLTTANYVVYQPYTFGGEAHGIHGLDISWATGARVALPLYSRNEGNVARAKLNVEQSHTQTASFERQVTSEVERAHLDCELSRNELSRTELGSLAEAARLRDAAERAYLAESPAAGPQETGRVNVLLRACDRYEKEDRRYIEILARYLVSALDLNTAVGKPIMP